MSFDDGAQATLASTVLSRESAAVGALANTVQAGVVAVARRMLEISGKVSELPVAVEGGVAEDIAQLCAAAGVHQMVVGRSLLISERSERREAI